MPRYKIVFTDYYYPDNDREVEILQQLGDVEIVDCTNIQPGGIKDPETLLEYVKDADGVICQFAKFTKTVIDQLEKCRVIARYAIGVDIIDVEAAKARGIIVANVPDYCIEEVSDSAIAHILNCVRKVSTANSLLRRGEWEYAKIKPIYRFSDATVGLIAFGNIARRVAEKLYPFGVTLLVYDPYFTPTMHYNWVKFASLEEVLAQADILSIHAPLTQETRHLLSKAQFDRMKNGAILVNTSRGGLIEETALLEALESGKVAMVGLDVLDAADTDYAQSPLLTYADRVIITPHIGWYSEESIVELQKKTAQNVYEVLKNGKPLYAI